MSVHEAMAGYLWLVGVLSTDSILSGYAPGGVYRSLAPVGTAPPFVIISFQSGPDTRTAQGVRILAMPLYQVKAVGPSYETALLVNAASRIDDLLKLASGSVAGGYIASCYRESELVLDNLVDGVQWSEMGGLYRTQIEQTT